jgi:hypothetical protein
MSCYPGVDDVTMRNSRLTRFAAGSVLFVFLLATMIGAWSIGLIAGSLFKEGLTMRSIERPGNPRKVRGGSASPAFPLHSSIPHAVFFKNNLFVM